MQWQSILTKIYSFQVFCFSKYFRECSLFIILCLFSGCQLNLTDNWPDSCQWYSITFFEKFNCWENMSVVFSIMNKSALQSMMSCMMFLFLVRTECLWLTLCCDFKLNQDPWPFIEMNALCPGDYWLFMMHYWLVHICDHNQKG